MEEAKVLEEMKRLAGTQTEKNLRAAFAGESQAHVKYNLFAAEAEKDPSISRQIADIFRETGANEKAMPNCGSGSSVISKRPPQNT